MSEIKIRVVTPEDASQLLAIYAPYVTDTAITFEYDVPDTDTFRGRISRTLERYPYLAALSDGKIIGYAYAGSFVGRAAYDWSVESSIYIAHDARHMGIGRTLYEALENILREMHILNINACIGVPREADNHLDDNSEKFHTHMGYRMVGRFNYSGYKFDTWYDMVWMEKMIGDHGENPLPVLDFAQVKDTVREKYGIA